jgi:hypothetical protein
MYHGSSHALYAEQEMPVMELLSVVAILKDLPEAGLVRGQVGTIAEKLSSAVMLVEFSDNKGRTCALVDVDCEDLVVLHYEPLEQAA